MRMRYAFAGLIVCWLAVCQPQAEAQFIQYGGGRGLQGSASRANTNAYERQVDLGNNLEYTQGLSNSRAVTRQNGQRTVSNSQARNNEFDVGGLQIGNTLTRTRTNANGAVSGGLANQFRIGNLGLGASLSPDNFRQGLGLQRSADGDVRLGLGLLSLDLDNNVQRTNTLSQAQVNAQGRGARVGSNTNSRVNQQQYGGLNVRETYSNSNAFGRSRNGQTSANAAGFGQDAATRGAYGGGFPIRKRRAPQLANRQQQPINRLRLRPKRHAQYVPFGYPQYGFNNFGQPNYGGFGNFDPIDRSRRQFGRPNNFGGNVGNGGFGQQSNKKRPQVQSAGNAGAQGGPGFNQQAGSNNFANQNADGSQDAGSSSIGSNLAQDGSSGQVSSANTNHQSKPGQSSNGAQSQALNFNESGQQATSSNANTQHIREGNSETIGSNSGSTATNNNQFGSSSNTANTDTQVITTGNQQTIKSGANSQSTFQGTSNQGNAAANTAANISSQRGPGGFVSNSASSSASATSTNGQSANANANASAGGNSNGAGAGANAANRGNRGNANANSNVVGGFNGGFGLRYRAQQQVQLKRWRPRPLNVSSGIDGIEYLYINRTSQLEDVQPTLNTSIEAFGDYDASQRQGRTFNVITDFISSLFGSCVSPCTLEAFQGNRCCETNIMVPYPPPQTCCVIPGPPRPIPPPPRPLPPPRPPPPYAFPYPLPGGNTPVMFIAPPINCCTVCTYTYYGPPPCGRFNYNNSYNNNRPVTIYVPPPFYGR